MEQNVRLTMIGRREGLPPDVLRELDRTARLTAGNDGMTLCLAINYGGRTEIADAARRLAEDVRAGTLDPDQVDESLFASYLATAGMPDPDLLIRTVGRAARQQLPALADLVFRALGHRDPLARLPGRRPARGLPRLRRPRAQVRRPSRGREVVLVIVLPSPIEPSGQEPLTRRP